MKLKMKLLDYTLIGLLAGTPAFATAQDMQEAQTDAASGNTQPPGDCVGAGDECRSDEGLVFRLLTLGESDPATQDGTPASSPAL